MRWPKKADRAGLHAGGAAWALGLVRGRGRPVPGGAAFWCVVAAARPTGNPAARIHPGRHDQDPDPVPSRLRPGAAAISRLLHECGPAPVVARAPERNPGRAAPPAPSQDPAATQAAWAVWQAGLTMPFTLPHNLPPLQLLLVWDNLTGHKTPR